MSLVIIYNFYWHRKRQSSPSGVPSWNQSGCCPPGGAETDGKSFLVGRRRGSEYGLFKPKASSLVFAISGGRSSDETNSFTRCCPLLSQMSVKSIGFHPGVGRETASRLNEASEPTGWSPMYPLAAWSDPSAPRHVMSEGFPICCTIFSMWARLSHCTEAVPKRWSSKANARFSFGTQPYIEFKAWMVLLTSWAKCCTAKAPLRTLWLTSMVHWSSSTSNGRGRRSVLTQARALSWGIALGAGSASVPQPPPPSGGVFALLFSLLSCKVPLFTGLAQFVCQICVPLNFNLDMIQKFRANQSVLQKVCCSSRLSRPPTALDSLSRAFSEYAYSMVWSLRKMPSTARELNPSNWSICRAFFKTMLSWICSWTPQDDASILRNCLNLSWWPSRPTPSTTK